MDDDEVSFNENDDDDDGINADFDGDDSDLNPLSSSENEGSDEQDAFGDLGGPVQESNSSDDDGQFSFFFNSLFLFSISSRGHFSVGS